MNLNVNSSAESSCVSNVDEFWSEFRDDFERWFRRKWILKSIFIAKRDSLNKKQDVLKAELMFIKNKW